MNIVMRIEHAFDEALRARQKVIQFDLSEMDYDELCRLAATHHLPANVGLRGEVNAYKKIPLYLNGAMTTSVATVDSGRIYLSARSQFGALPPSGYRQTMLH